MPGMLILWLIITGLIVGAIARLVVPGRNPIGILMTILLGIVGALAGGFIAHAIGAGALIQFILAVVVAAVLVALMTGARGGRRRNRLILLRQLGPLGPLAPPGGWGAPLAARPPPPGRPGPRP